MTPVLGSIVTISPVAAGQTTITVTASDGTLSAEQEISITVLNTAPTVNTGLTDTTASPGSLFTYTFPADAFQDADNDELTYTSSGQPPWLTFTSGSRTFSGTPPNTDNSPFNITVTADDGNGGRVQATFVLTIPIGICTRTSQVQTAILSVIDGVTDCALVTDAHLAGITNSLNLRNQSITALQKNDFSGMSNLSVLNFYDNDLTTLPAGVFSNLSNLRFLSLYSNDLTTLPAGVFSNLSNLQILSLDGNGLSTLPDNVFSNLSNLQTLSLNGNMLRVLPDSVFFGLNNLRYLDLSGNTNAPFTFTLMLERTDNADLTAAGPATIKVKVAQGAPFDMTVGLSVTNGTLMDANGNAVTEVTISTGSIESEAITVTQSGGSQVTVSLGTAPALPSDYTGLQTAVGSPLVLF